MKIIIVVMILYALDACNAQSECLAAAPSGSKLCYEVQLAGQQLATEIKSLDTLVQSTIYQSMQEGSKMLASGMELLRKEVASLRVSSPGTAPIEQSAMATLTANAEAVAKESVKTANKELQNELVKALKQVLGDDAFTNNIVKALGLSTSTSRKRRSTVISSDDDLGNSIDGAVDKVLPAVNQTLAQADLKMKVAFKSIFNAFLNSVKQLVGGKVGINLDEVDQNMEKMIIYAAKNLIDSNVEYARNLITQILKILQKVAALGAPYKTDAAKLTKIMEPARMLVSEAISKTSSPSHDTALVKRIEAATAKLKEYYEDIKKIVST